MITRTKYLFALCLLSLFLLTACGQKGPLYLPDPNPESTDTGQK
ncbi:LPS translocon maturation chaperone LptM [Gynuella sp.]